MTDRRANRRFTSILPGIAALAVAALVIAALAVLSPSASAQTDDGPREDEICDQVSQTDRVIAEGIDGTRTTQTIERTTRYLCTWREDVPGTTVTIRSRSYTTRTRWTETTGLI